LAKKTRVILFFYRPYEKLIDRFVLLTDTKSMFFIDYKVIRVRKFEKNKLCEAFVLIKYDTQKNLT
jgi:hypothetical protein